jgi:hypothetical protein
MSKWCLYRMHCIYSCTATSLKYSRLIVLGRSLIKLLFSQLQEKDLSYRMWKWGQTKVHVYLIMHLLCTVNRERINLPEDVKPMQDIKTLRMPTRIWFNFSTLISKRSGLGFGWTLLVAKYYTSLEMYGCVNNHRLIISYIPKGSWLYNPNGPWLLLLFIDLYTVDRTPWTRDQPVAWPPPTQDQHKQRINAHRHSCLEWDSKSRSQCSSGSRRFMP